MFRLMIRATTTHGVMTTASTTITMPAIAPELSELLPELELELKVQLRSLPAIAIDTFVNVSCKLKPVEGFVHLN